MALLIACALLLALWVNIGALIPAPEEKLTLSPLRADTRALPADTEGKLNLNAAGKEELMALPGIGEKTAEAILALREQLGSFRFPEDLLLVRGIGSEKLSALSDLVYAEPIE